MNSKSCSVPLSGSAARFSRREALRLFGAAGAATLLAARGLRADQPATAATAAAPVVAGEQPGFYRFHIGQLEALALSDGGISGALDQIWTGGTKEKIAADLEAAAMPTSRVDLPFGVLLVKLGAELVLIDTGSGKLFGPSAGRLPASLQAAGIDPAQISSIFITHAHGDHFGGLLDPATKAPVFTRAKLFIRRREYEYWTSEQPDVSEMVIPAKRVTGAFTSAREYLRAFAGQWQFVEPGDQPLPGLEVIDAAGHTPGQIGFLISSGTERLLHLADTVHHHAVSFANPDWYYNFDAFPKLAVTTRHRLLDRAADERLRVFGSHLPFPALGRVRKSGSGYEHIIEPWVSVGGA